MTDKQLLEQALEVLEYFSDTSSKAMDKAMAEDAITAIRARLEQPEQEYERGFIDGMQKQMQSSVDKAVNAMSQRGKNT